MASSKRIHNANPSSHSHSGNPINYSSSNPPTSIADEIRKISMLRDEGRITDEEYQQLKKDLLSRN